MTLLVPGSRGLEIIDVGTAHDFFNPAEGTALSEDYSAFWGVVPQEIRHLNSTDRRAVELVWASYLRAMSGELQDAFFLDMSRSLLQAPPVRERRWIKMDLLKTVLMADVSTNVSNEGPYEVISKRQRGQSMSKWSMGRKLVTPNALRIEFTGTADVTSLGGVFIGWGDGSNRVGVLISQTESYPVGARSSASAPFGWDHVVDTVVVSVTYRPGYAEINLQSGESLYRWALGAWMPVTWAGVGPVDSEVASLFPLERFPASETVTIRSESVKVYDPSLPVGTVAVPTLRPRLIDAVGALSVGFDYRVEEAIVSESHLPPVMWAETIAIDEGWVRRIFGPLTCLGPTLPKYGSYEDRAGIAGILFSRLSAGAIGAVAVGVAAITGAKFAVEPGVVIATTTPSGGRGVQILEPRGVRTYTIPEPLEIRVRLGDTVRRWEFLSSGVDVMDVYSRPRMIAQKIAESGGHEIQKFSTVRVRATLVNLGKTAISTARNTINTLLSQTMPNHIMRGNDILEWMWPFRDRLTTRDAVTWVGPDADRLIGTVMRMYDALGKGPHYDYGIGELLYGAGVPSDYEYGSTIRWEDPITLTVLNNGASPVSFSFLESDYTLGPDESATMEVPGDQVEYDVSFSFTNDGDVSVRASLLGSTIDVAPSTTGTITAWVTSPSEVVTLTISNPSASTATVTFDGDEYEIPTGESVDIEIEVS